MLSLLAPLGRSATRASHIDLRGMPAPFAAGRSCMPSEEDHWFAGGGGQVQHQTPRQVREWRPTHHDLNAVFFVSPRRGWIVGEAGTILFTEDAGLGWTQQASGVEQSLHSLSCPDARTCAAVGSALSWLVGVLRAPVPYEVIF